MKGSKKTSRWVLITQKATKVTFDVGAFIAINANKVTIIDNLHNGFSSIYIFSKHGRRTPFFCVLRLLVCSIHLKKHFLKLFLKNCEFGGLELGELASKLVNMGYDVNNTFQGH